MLTPHAPDPSCSVPENLRGQTLLVRTDINVPHTAGQVSDATRIQRMAPGLQGWLDAGARVVLLSHLGRPRGAVVPELSLRVLLESLRAHIQAPLHFCPHVAGPEVDAAVAVLNQGEVLLLENVRFDPREEAPNPERRDALAQQWARWSDFYINDAFACAHRAHASTTNIARLCPHAAGPLLQAELDALQGALEQPERPVLAIVGGAKISSKIDVLEALIPRMDAIIIAGAMANTFMLACGEDIGTSLAEPEHVDTVRRILSCAAQKTPRPCELHLPHDHVVAAELTPSSPHQRISRGAPVHGGKILDIGPHSVQAYTRLIAAHKTVLWNGPLGAFESAPFDQGSLAIARTIAHRCRAGALTAVAGGGDTVALLNTAEATQDLSYVSTAGGAFLEWLEGKTLPGIAALTAAVSTAQQRSA